MFQFPDANCRAFFQTASNIFIVNFPVEVFCRLGWYEQSSQRSAVNL
jgi:hypothetical protein